MKTINVSGYGKLNFPDEMSQDEIAQAIDSGIESGQIKAQNSSNNEARTNNPLTDSRQYLPQIGKTAEAFTHGLKRAGAGGAQFLAPAIEYLQPALASQPGGVLGQVERYMVPEEQKFKEQYGDSTPYKVAAFAGEMAPFLAGGSGMALTKAPAALMKMAQGAPAAVRGLTSAAGIFGKNAAVAAPAGALAYDPTFTETGIEGGLQKGGRSAPVGGLIGSSLAGITRLPNVSSKLISMFGDKGRAANTIPELQGLETGLGEAIDSPALKQFEEKVLEKMPFSGTKGSQYKTGRILESEGEKLLSDLAPNYKTEEGTQDVGAKILDSLKNYKAEVTDIKNQKYSTLSEMADMNNVKIKPKNIMAVTKKIRSNINKSNKEWGPTPKSDKNVLMAWVDSFKNAAGGGFSGANFKRSELGDAIKNAKGDFLKSQLVDIKAALTKDMHDGFTADGVPSYIKEAFKSHQAYYKDVYVPIAKDPDISKFLKDGADTDTIVSHFLKKGSIDRPNLFNKLASKIPQEDKNLIAREYLNKAFSTSKEGQSYLSPKKLISLYKGLGEKTRKNLFSDPAFQEKINTYITRVDKNPSAETALFNEKTGSSTPYLYALGGLLTAATTSIVTANPLPIIGAVSTLAGGGIASKMLRSPKIREFYMNSPKEYFSPSKYTDLISGASGIMGSRSILDSNIRNE
ncbi:hypothetical protein UFOVP1361_65 [uncultured Caudovirales phage]|uniref:Uncharacterized protein n=1 Tax=uncultured Caudovirales phage TaxID=2100421 RepID=A0A6J5RUN2_9CAUD|nr:hypothetical protein UFOVP1361_65 [uncultured Caudovirales phage]